MSGAPGVVAVVLVTVATLVIGTWGLRFSRTTSDFFVASRTVRPGLNASAIGGEYLSAASFLGIAGLVLTFGADMLWYPIGWTSGYLVLLVLVAAPLRRSGAYTLPDFAEARLDSRRARGICSALVVAIGWLYLLPQFQGAGITLAAAIDAPVWVGPVIVGLVVLANVSSGGMRSITFVQAFQYWLKLTALLVPVVVLLGVWAERRIAGVPARRRPVVAAGGRRWADRPLHDVLADRGDVPRHDGAAPRRRPLLHQPRRAGGPPDDAGRAGAAGGLLPPAAPLRPPRQRVRRRPGRRGPLRRAGPRAAATDARRGRRGAVVGPGHGRCVRGVPVDLVGAVDRGGRGAQPGRDRPHVARTTAGRDRRVPAGSGGRRGGAAGAGPRAAQRGRRARGGAGLRRGGLDLLPAAGAGHLVAWADRRRRRRRDPRRRPRLRRAP